MPSAAKAGQSRADPAGVGIHGLASTCRPGSVQSWIIRAPIRVNGGSGPPFLLAPALPGLERAVMAGAGRSRRWTAMNPRSRRLWWIVVALILELMVLVRAASRNRQPARGSGAITDR